MIETLMEFAKHLRYRAERTALHRELEAGYLWIR